MAWGSSTTTTESSTLPGMGTQEAGARATLEQLSKGGMGQLGNLKDLASGKLQLSPEDMALIRQIQELTAKQAQESVKSNYDLMASQTAGETLQRGISGSSIDAVNQALLGKQLQSSLDQSALQGQITSADQMRKGMYENAGIKLNANQLLLNQIMGGSEALGRMGLEERLAQKTTTQKSTESPGVGAFVLKGLDIVQSAVGK
jgi:hypothetical protein